MNREFKVFTKDTLQHLKTLKSEGDAIRFLTAHPKSLYLIIEIEKVTERIWARYEGTNLHGFIIKYENE